MKKGPDPFEEDPEMKDLRLSGEQLTDMPSRPPTRSAEEWRSTKGTDTFQVPGLSCLFGRRRACCCHYAQNAPSLNTIHLDTGYWVDWSLDEKRYFIAAALRVEHAKAGILIPFIVPVENKSAAVVPEKLLL